MLSENQREKIVKSFRNKTLRVRSVSPTGEMQWKRVLQVQRAEVGPESIWEARTETGPMVLTGGHRVFLTPTEKLEMEKLTPGTHVLGICRETVGSPNILGMKRLEDRKYMYDLTAEDWHNFLLQRSQVVISNSPDRNYHFRPPEHEQDINQFNRIFGFIWEDEELITYLQCALDAINATPPSTGFCNLSQLIQSKPQWRIYLMWGAIVHAAMALAFNWAADEFDYSIGGISLSIDKFSKYNALKENAEGQFDKFLGSGEGDGVKSRTTKIFGGLQQPKFGVGIRSAFGPNVAQGVLSPRSFI